MFVTALGLTALLLVALLLCVKPLGLYMAQVFEGRALLAMRLGGPLEARLYRVCGVDPAREMDWREYALALLKFNILGALALYLLQRCQAWLPLNPQKFSNLSPDSAFNTAVSFVTNTNWQGYSGETTMSYLTQMVGLTVQNFLSAATGLVIAIALIRGLARHGSATIGNAWVDVTRSTLYVLLPLSLVLAMVLVSQGVIQNLGNYRDVVTLEPLTYQVPQTDAAGNAATDSAGKPLQRSVTSTTQTLPMGPVASQESIKELGTNGGGFFNANSAHPFENPSALTNFLEMLAILLIPAALTYTFGRMVGDTRQGWAVLAAMALLFVTLLAVVLQAELAGNPLLAHLGVDQAGGNMEGKETRFGSAASALFAAVTTATSCGAVNGMHDSFTPLGGLVPLFQMQLGEVVFGGVGTGLYSMLIFAIVGVFIAGLMIGRTPEYLGKKIEAFEMKMSSIAILVMPLIVLTGTAIAVSTGPGRAAVGNPGAHGFSEILYAFSSAGNNNGSAFGGISANTPFYNVALGITMWLGRFWPIAAVLAVAGSLAAKKRIPPGEGTMPTHGVTFVVLLIGTVLLVGALTFVPALALGPIVEHLMLWARGGRMNRRSAALFDRSLLKPACLDALTKLSPRVQWRNPVMFVVYVGSLLTTGLWLRALAGHGEAPAWFIFNVALWLWFTVLFANFAESLAEGRSKAQAAALRGLKQTVWAKKLADPSRHERISSVRADELRRGDVVLIEAGDHIPADGDVIQGAASVDESAITGESAPVIRESGGDFSAVTGGTRVLSDWIIVQVSVNPGETFLDRMIAMVENARRQKTPNEIALTILLVALTLVFLLATATLLPYSLYSVAVTGSGSPISITALIALLDVPDPDHHRRNCFRPSVSPA